MCSPQKPDNPFDHSQAITFTLTSLLTNSYFNEPFSMEMSCSHLTERLAVREPSDHKGFRCIECRSFLC